MEENKKNNAYKIIMLVILVAFITFLITTVGIYQFLINGNSSKFLVIDKMGLTKNDPKTDDISDSLDKYKSIIDKYYLGEIDEEKLKEGAIKGYFQALDDPYTEFITKEDMKDFLEDTKGNFVGIGIYMVKDEKSNKIQVLAPIKDSPAEKIGILPGDLIIEVDGKEYTGDDMTVAANNIKEKKEQL